MSLFEGFLSTVFAFRTKDSEGEKSERKIRQQSVGRVSVREGFSSGNNIVSRNICLSYLRLPGLRKKIHGYDIWMLVDPFLGTRHIALNFINEAAIGNSTSFMFFNI